METQPTNREIMEAVQGLGQTFVRLDQNVSEMAKTLGGQIDFLAQKSIEHDERFDQIDAKLDQCVTKTEFAESMEGFATNVRDLQQESASHTLWLRRLDPSHRP